MSAKLTFRGVHDGTISCARHPPRKVRPCCKHMVSGLPVEHVNSEVDDSERLLPQIVFCGTTVQYGRRKRMVRPWWTEPWHPLRRIGAVRHSHVSVSVMSGQIASLPKHSDYDVSVCVSITDKRDAENAVRPRPREYVELCGVACIVAKSGDEDV